MIYHMPYLNIIKIIKPTSELCPLGKVHKVQKQLSVENVRGGGYSLIGVFFYLIFHSVDLPSGVLKHPTLRIMFFYLMEGNEFCKLKVIM